MKYVYYIKALIYFGCALYVTEDNLKIVLLGLAVLMVFFATQLSIKEYIDDKFAEKDKNGRQDKNTRSDCGEYLH